jgi:O-antigen ligase
MNIQANRGRRLSYILTNEPLTFLGGLLFFLMVFSPAYNVIFKIVLIAILLVSIILSRIVFDKLNVTREVILWYALFIGHGIFFSILGLLNGNNSSYILRSTTYNILWPIVYLIFTIGLYKKSTLYFFMQVLVISNFLIALYLIGSDLTMVGLLPPLPLIKFDMASLSGDTLEGLVKAEAPSVTCLLFTVPFVIALSLLDKEKRLGFSKTFLNVSILISIIAVLATARRALILNIFLGLLLTIFFTRKTHGISKRIFARRVYKMLFWGVSFLIIVLIFVQQLGFLDFILIYQKFLSAFSSQADASTATRYEQFDLLIRSWQKKPLLGFGHGAVSQYIVRSEDRPWMYELSYVALLFQTGIIGLLTYLGLLAWPVFKGMQLLKRGTAEASVFIVPIIVGCFCFLVANATNPYLQSYDYMWALFLPIAVVNYFMKEL